MSILPPGMELVHDQVNQKHGGSATTLVGQDPPCWDEIPVHNRNQKHHHRQDSSKAHPHLDMLDCIEHIE